MQSRFEIIFDGFHKAAANGAAFDRFYYDFFSLDREAYGDIPRPALWANNVKALRWVPRLQVFIYYVWKYFSYLLFFLQITRLMLRRFFCADIQVSKVNRQVVALGVCQRSVDVIGKSYLKDKSQYVWLIPSGVELDVDKDCYLSSSEMLNLSDLFYVLYFACRIHAKMTALNDKSKIFQTYSVVNWLVIFMSLIKLKPDTVVTSEHHDRWAVLVDTYCGYMKILGVEKINFVMVQHGSEFLSTYKKLKDIGYCDGLPCKIINVTDIFVYDNLQLGIFRENILKSGCRLNYFFYQYDLLLTPVNDDRKKILIVGNSFCESFHIKIYDDLYFKYNYLWIYKPHPVQKPSKAVLTVGWRVVDDSSFFPKVDLVISYPSTLVSEYMSAGVDVVEHSVTCDEVDFNAVKSRVKLLSAGNIR